MTIVEPRWWKDAVIEDVGGVGIVKGLAKNTPSDIVKEFKKDMNKKRDIEYEGEIFMD